MAEMRTMVMMVAARMYTNKSIFLCFELGASMDTTSFTDPILNSAKNIFHTYKRKEIDLIIYSIICL